jgi:predicted SnoaL-like aldol condensation-catalyzing enzyme
MTETISQSHKNSAIDFLKLVTSGRIDEAYKKHVDLSGKHHNCYFPSGLQVLKNAMIENHKQFPVKHYSVKNVVGDGDLVAVHGHLVFKEGEPGMVVVHLFRFDGGKIVEFWDCGQQIPADMPNKDGVF